MMNFCILCLHISVIGGLSLFALRFGKEMMIAWLSLLVIAMNLFVLKQITLFGLRVTTSDALVVGYLLGLNLLQEFYDKNTARKCMGISFFISAAFMALSSIQLLYIPNVYDQAHPHLAFLFTPMPRLLLASFLTFLIVQLFNLAAFHFLKEKWKGGHFVVRNVLILILSQALDTVLFSYLGLYGLVVSIPNVIMLGFSVKCLAVFLSTPFLSLSKKVCRHVQV